MTTVLEKETQELAIHEQFRRRRSVRAFSSQPVEAEKLHRIFEAARWAPSASNEQPWTYIVATKDQPADFERLASTIKEGNYVWAQYAPVLLLSVAKRFRDRDNSENRHAFHDVGQSVASLSLQALEEGLYIRQMGGFSVDKAREVLNIPEGYEPVAVLALGYPGDLENLPDALQQREQAPRTRKPLSEIVFEGTWGKPFVDSQYPPTEVNG